MKNSYKFLFFEKIRSKPSIILTFFLLAFVVVVTYAVYARSSGYTGVTSSTSNGCYCHSTGANSNVSLSVSSETGSFTVQTGSTLNLTITVSSSNSNHTAAGIDIAVKTTTTGETNAGTLSPGTGSGLQLSSGELTHSSPKSLQSGFASFTFSWTAPSQPGNYYLRAIANCVNGNGNADANDQWNRLAIQTITVQEAPSITVNSPNGGEIWCQGTSHNITWSATAVQNVDIAISSDNGANYTNLVTNLSASSGSWTWNIPSNQTPGNQYLIRISKSSDLSVADVSNSTFIIGEPPQISQNPESVTACTGQSVSFRVVATGSGLTYVWRKYGENIPNSNSPTLNINPVTLNSGGTYDCVVTGACGSIVTSSSATLSVDESPTISQQPQPVSVCVGGQAEFSVVASGTDLIYQWRKGGNPISGATSATLTIANVQKSDEGMYDCIVSGKCSPSRTSVQAKLTVNEPPQIISHPKSASTCEGGKATFKVSAIGTDLKFQWRKNGNNIANATDSVFNIDNVSVSDLGTYDVIVSGACPPQQFSETVIINIIKAPEITIQPADTTVPEGADINFSIAAKGENLKYQWMKDNNELSGKTTANLLLKNVRKSDEGRYSCTVTNDCGTTTSKVASLIVQNSPTNPQLSLLNTLVDFGSIINIIKDTVLSGFIKNIGTQTLEITKINITGNDASDLSVSVTNLPLSLNQGETADMTLSFNPKSEGQKSAFLEFESNSEINPKLALIGFVGDIILELPTSPFELSTTSIDIPTERQLIIVNNGTLDAGLSLSIAGEDAGAFSIKDDKNNISIKSKSSEFVTIRFEPKKMGESNANLIISINGKNEPLILALKGNISTSVDETNLQFADVSIYPNPSNNILNFLLTSLSDEIISIKILDLKGNEYFKLDKVIPKNELFEFNWDGRDRNGNMCPSGFYSLIIQSGKYSKSYGFIMTK